jgi:hypothetical protein
MYPAGAGTSGHDTPRDLYRGSTMKDFSVALLTVLGVLAGVGVLLFLMTAVDPTNDQRKSPSHKAPRRAVTPTTAGGE